MEKKRIDCRKCKHFEVTWDKSFPYGCKAMGFKTAFFPSLEVFRSSGVACLRFEQKPKPER
jgi:hypothetical protein